jgi:hypothetical protein
MEFSTHKTLKWMEMDFSMNTKETLEQVKAMDVVNMTVLTHIQITICPTLRAVPLSLHVQVIENTGVSTFLLLIFVLLFMLLDYKGKSLRIRIMWCVNTFVVCYLWMSRKFRLELV